MLKRPLSETSTKRWRRSLHGRARHTCQHFGALNSQEEVARFEKEEKEGAAAADYSGMESSSCSFAVGTAATDPAPAAGQKQPSLRSCIGAMQGTARLGRKMTKKRLGLVEGVHAPVPGVMPPSESSGASGANARRPVAGFSDRRCATVSYVAGSCDRG